MSNDTQVKREDVAREIVDKWHQDLILAQAERGTALGDAVRALPGLAERIASALATVRREAFKEAIKIVQNQPSTTGRSLPPATIPPSTLAKAAQEIGAWIFKLERPLTSETDLRVATDHVQAIIERCFSAEQTK